MTWSDPNRENDESAHSLSSGVFNSAGVQVVGTCGSSFITDVIKVERQGIKSAVKILTPAAKTDFEIVSRFLTNARYNQGLGEFTGLRITEVVESGPRPYYVMEKIAESSLLEIIRLHAPIDPLWLTKLLLPISSMLDTIHQRNLLHGNIKPSNFLVNVENNEEKLLLVDFLEPSLLATSATLMSSGPYAAPEFRMGTPISNRADVYSLAAVMYEALSGVVPGRAYRNKDGSFHVWRPSDPIKPLNLMNPEISRPVSDVIMSALAPQAVNRPASATTLVNDVFRHLEEPRTRVRVGEIKEEKAPVPMLFIGVAVFVAILVLFGAFKVVTSIFSGSDNKPIESTLPISTGSQSTQPEVIVPNEAEVALEEKLPVGNQVCTPDRSEGENKKWPLAIAILRCSAPELTSLTYGSFGNTADVDDTYKNQASFLQSEVESSGGSLKIGQPGTSPCSINENESGEWGSRIGGGKYTCVSSPKPRIIWTEKNSAVMGDAYIESGNIADLVAWWNKKSGPV